MGFDVTAINNNPFKSFVIRTNMCNYFFFQPTAGNAYNNVSPEAFFLLLLFFEPCKRIFNA